MDETRPSIPDKLYFKIGEVSKITGLPSYVLRFWETEFDRIHPKRSPSGQRRYRKNDVRTILKIKHLLYEQKLTIPGARLQLKKKTSAPPEGPLGKQVIRRELMQIRDMLDDF